MLSTLLTYEASATTAQIKEVIREQTTSELVGEYGMSDCLRTAAMYCPLTMEPKQWVEACVSLGIHPGTARNRLNEVRHQQAELGSNV